MMLKVITSIKRNIAKRIDSIRYKIFEKPFLPLTNLLEAMARPEMPMEYKRLCPEYVSIDSASRAPEPAIVSWRDFSK